MSEEEPTRRTLDAAALKALAHPLRVDMIDQLGTFGNATASQLAERLDQSSGATSYHLRQLERHGLVREVEGKGSARERWWEMVPGGLNITLSEDSDPASIEAGKLISRQWADQRHRQLDLFLRKAGTEIGDEWTEHSLLLSTRLNLTPEELGEATKELAEVIDRIIDKFKPLGERPGTLPIQVQINAFPILDGPGAKA